MIPCLRRPAPALLLAAVAALAAGCSSAPSATPLPAATSSGTAIATGTVTASAVYASQPLAAQAVAARLAAAKIQVKGVPKGALSWHDENTLTIVLVTVETAGTVDAGRTFTVRTYLAGGLDQADGGRLRDEIVDTGGGLCHTDGGADVVPGSLTVSDADGDGHTEATAGWYWACAGDPSPYAVTLTMFTRGKHYQLTGTGTLRARPLPSSFTAAPVTAAPAPASSDWPAGLYAPALALFGRLYV